MICDRMKIKKLILNAIGLEVNEKPERGNLRSGFLFSRGHA